jgi:uncharacterized membrane protein
MRWWIPVVVMVLMTQMEQGERKQQEPLSAVTQQYMFAGIGTLALACVISYEL